ncbi:hypothetical protein [Nonomuraea helvata]|uniref:Uncharacterized protein n=1 Tax=Nonomuraea helvata TaxID=37484 RepID=A0ABV5SA09_9ACTN
MSEEVSTTSSPAATSYPFGQAFRPWTDVNVDQWILLTNPDVTATFWTLRAA